MEWIWVSALNRSKGWVLGGRNGGASLRENKGKWERTNEGTQGRGIQGERYGEIFGNLQREGERSRGGSDTRRGSMS